MTIPGNFSEDKVERAFQLRRNWPSYMRWPGKRGPSEAPFFPLRWKARRGTWQHLPYI